MPFGPSQYSFWLDGYNASTNVVSAQVELVEIEECSGIDEDAMVDSDYHLGDDIKSEAPINVSTFGDISLKGQVEVTTAGVIDPDSAFARIGRPARRDDYPARTFTIRKRGTTLSQSIEVFVKKNMPMSDGEKLVRYEAVLGIKARDRATDYAEVGF